MTSNYFRMESLWDACRYELYTLRCWTVASPSFFCIFLLTLQPETEQGRRTSLEKFTRSVVSINHYAVPYPQQSQQNWSNGGGIITATAQEIIRVDSLLVSWRVSPTLAHCSNNESYKISLYRTKVLMWPSLALSNTNIFTDASAIILHFIALIACPALKKKNSLQGYYRGDAGWIHKGRVHSVKSH